MAIDDDDAFLRALSTLVSRSDIPDDARPGEIIRAICAISELDADVQAEGFLHYFAYSREDYAEVVEALSTVGATEQARLLIEAVRVFPGQRIPPAHQRLDVIESLEANPANDAELRNLESRWVAAVPLLAKAMRSYVAEHQSEIELLQAESLSNDLDASKIDDEALFSIAHAPGGLKRLQHVLLDAKRLPVLLRLGSVGEPVASADALKLMHAIVGNVGVQLLGGHRPHDMDIVMSCIESAACDSRAVLRDWSQDARSFLQSPDPEVALRWMGSALLD